METSACGVLPLRGFASFVHLHQTQQQDVGAFPNVVLGFLLLLLILLQWDSETGFALQGSSSPAAGMRAGGQSEPTCCCGEVCKM